MAQDFTASFPTLPSLSLTLTHTSADVFFRVLFPLFSPSLSSRNTCWRCVYVLCAFVGFVSHFCAFYGFVSHSGSFLWFFAWHFYLRFSSVFLSVHVWVVVYLMLLCAHLFVRCVFFCVMCMCMYMYVLLCFCVPFFVCFCILMCTCIHCYIILCLCVCFCIITCICRPVHIHVTEDTLVPFNFLSEASSWPN